MSPKKSRLTRARIAPPLTIIAPPSPVPPVPSESEVSLKQKALSSEGASYVLGTGQKRARGTKLFGFFCG